MLVKIPTACRQGPGRGRRTNARLGVQGDMFSKNSVVRPGSNLSNTSEHQKTVLVSCASTGCSLIIAMRRELRCAEVLGVRTLLIAPRCRRAHG